MPLAASLSLHFLSLPPTIYPISLFLLSSQHPFPSFTAFPHLLLFSFLSSTLPSPFYHLPYLFLSPPFFISPLPFPPPASLLPFSSLLLTPLSQCHWLLPLSSSLFHPFPSFIPFSSHTFPLLLASFLRSPLSLLVSPFSPSSKKWRHLIRHIIEPRSAYFRIHVIGRLLWED